MVYKNRKHAIFSCAKGLEEKSERIRENLKSQLLNEINISNDEKERILKELAIVQELISKLKHNIREL